MKTATNNTTANTISLAFAATDKYLESNVPVLEEAEERGKHYIKYGTENDYPDFLNSLYLNVSTLKTIIDGTANYVAGDDIVVNLETLNKTRANRKGHSWRNIIEWVAKDYMKYGGYALQVIRNKVGQVSEVYYLDFRFVRSDKDNEVFYYSEDFGKKYGRANKMIVYPKFIFDSTEPASVVYVKNTLSSTYPMPRYSGAIKACLIEEAIDDLHLNSLENGFMPSYLISLLNGVPSDEQKAEIERDIQEKFCGSKNAGRVILNFAVGKDNGAQVDQLDITDFSDKYKAAAERSREQIYTAFQAVPQLFGLVSASTGFNEQEFKEAFKLYNRTVVRGMQRDLCDTFDWIYGSKNVLTIKPFSIDDEDKETNVQ